MHRRTLAAAAAALLLLTGCAGGVPRQAEVSPTPSDTPSAQRQWQTSDGFQECIALYDSVPGASQDASTTCYNLGLSNDPLNLIAAFSETATVDAMRADLEAQVLAKNTPPAASEPSPPEASAHVISEQARHVLAVNLGAGFEAAPAIKDQYCTMSDATLANTAGVMVGMYRDIVEADVIAYVNQVCGR